MRDGVRQAGSTGRRKAKRQGGPVKSETSVTLQSDEQRVLSRNEGVPRVAGAVLTLWGERFAVYLVPEFYLLSLAGLRAPAGVGAESSGASPKGFGQGVT